MICAHGWAHRRSPGSFAAVGVVCLLFGCATAPAPPPAARPPTAPPATAVEKPAPGPGPTAARPAAPLGPKSITARIKALEAKLLKGAKADPRGEISLELAKLYSHPANPSPDHGKALAMMRAYLSLAPPDGKDPEADRLLALLEAIDRLGRLLRDSRTREKEYVGQIQSLQQRERELQEREQEQLAEIELLRARIDKLKTLDLEMEKRRKSVR